MSCVTCHISCVTFHVSGVMCLVTWVTFHMSLVTCHLSPVANTNSQIHPSPVNSPIMHSRLVCKDPKTKTHVKTQKKKTHWNNKNPKMPIQAIHTDRRLGDWRTSQLKKTKSQNKFFLWTFDIFTENMPMFLTHASKLTFSNQYYTNKTL